MSQDCSGGGGCPCKNNLKRDVEDIKFVINYDYPNSSEDYVHRIGRTARSTNKGTAYTFFTPGNVRQARDLVKVLHEARQAVNPRLLQLVDSGRGGGGGRMRYRSSGSSVNPNMMFQDKCEQRMRTGGGGNDVRGSSSSSSYRGRSSYTSGGNQYQSYGRSGSQLVGSSAVSGGGKDQPGQSHTLFGPALPPPQGVRHPLMAPQFSLAQPPIMSFVS